MEAYEIDLYLSRLIYYNVNHANTTSRQVCYVLCIYSL